MRKSILFAGLAGELALSLTPPAAAQIDTRVGGESYGIGWVGEWNYSSLAPDRRLHFSGQTLRSSVAASYLDSFTF